MDISRYRTLFKLYKQQPVNEVLAHFHPDKDPLTGSLDFSATFKKIASKTFEGATSRDFTLPRFQNKYSEKPPKLRNYLRYTFIRLRDLEMTAPGTYFVVSDDTHWVSFNTGLQDKHSADLFCVFQRYQPRTGQEQPKPAADWVYRGTVTSREDAYRDHFGTRLPRLAWYSD